MLNLTRATLSLGGAKERMDSATDEQDCSQTDINDFVWFECDEIFDEDENEDE